MDCNRDEGLKAIKVAEKKFMANDFEAAKKFALKAQKLNPALEGISQMLATFNVYIIAKNMIAGQIDWYQILNVSATADDEILRKQYKKLALAFHPDKNKSVGAEGAFRFIKEAWNVLSDKATRMEYDQQRKANGFQQQPPETSESSSAPNANGSSKFSNTTSSETPPMNEGDRPKAEESAEASNEGEKEHDDGEEEDESGTDQWDASWYNDSANVFNIGLPLAKDWYKEEIELEEEELLHIGELRKAFQMGWFEEGCAVTAFFAPYAGDRYGEGACKKWPMLFAMFRPRPHYKGIGEGPSRGLQDFMLPPFWDKFVCLIQRLPSPASAKLKNRQLRSMTWSFNNLHSVGFPMRKVRAYMRGLIYRTQQGRKLEQELWDVEAALQAMKTSSQDQQKATKLREKLEAAKAEVERLSNEYAKVSKGLELLKQLNDRQEKIIQEQKRVKELL